MNMEVTIWNTASILDQISYVLFQYERNASFTEDKYSKS